APRSWGRDRSRLADALELRPGDGSAPPRARAERRDAGWLRAAPGRVRADVRAQALAAPGAESPAPRGGSRAGRAQTHRSLDLPGRGPFVLDPGRVVGQGGPRAP